MKCIYLVYLKYQFRLLKEINLDLKKGARRDGVDLIEHNFSSSAGVRPKPISQNFMRDIQRDNRN